MTSGAEPRLGLHSGADECDAPLYGVVVNDEEQYSVWPLVLDIPAGWRLQGSTGTRAECLGVITRIWTELVPRSARRDEARE